MQNDYFAKRMRRQHAIDRKLAVGALVLVLYLTVVGFTAWVLHYDPGAATPAIASPDGAHGTNSQPGPLTRRHGRRQ